MAITPPTTYDDTNPVTGLGIRTGAVIKPGGLQTLGANANFAYGHFRPPVAHTLDTRGIASSSGSTRDVLVWPYYGSLDASGGVVKLVGKFVAKKNAGSGGRVVLKTTADSDQISVGGASPSTYTWPEIEANDTKSVHPLIVQTQNQNVTLYFAEVHWTTEGGTVITDDSRRPSGWVWFQSEEFAANRPITIEHYNRFAKAPGILRAAFPHCSASMACNVTASNATWAHDAAAYVQQTLVPLVTRFPDTLKVAALITGNAAGRVQVTNTATGQSIEMAPGASALPSNPSTSYTFTEGELDVVKGINVLSVAIKGDGTNWTDLWSLGTFQGV